LPGMNASIHIKFAGKNDTLSTAVSVPTFAIFQENGQHFVWKVKADDMTVAKAPVKIKDGIGQELIVTEGLQTGDTIVGAGASYLTEGMVVRPWTKP